MRVKSFIPFVNFAVVLLFATSVVVHAQSGVFPNRPVRIIVPYAAGGGTDILTRAIAHQLNEIWGQTVVVDNRGGAGGVVGTAIAAKARPDGYTITLNSIAIATVPALYDNLPYDTLRDLAPVALVASQPSLMVINPSLPVNSLGEFIKLAKANPDKFTIGSGAGAALLAIALFRSASGLKIVDVRYKGAAQPLTELMAGNIQLAVSPASLVMPFITSGKLKGLAVAGSKRSTLAPALPTVAEAGLPDYEFEHIWYGILTAAGVPTPVLNQLNRDILRALGATELRKWFATAGLEPLTSTPEEFSRYLKAEIAKWARVIKTAGIKAD